MKRVRALCLLSAVMAGVFLPAGAIAQDASAEGEFSVQRFEPAPGANNFVTVQRARMEGNYAWAAGLMFNYARDPFVVVSCRTETDCGSPNAVNQRDVSVVKDLFTWDLLAAISPLEFLQIGLRFPVAYVSGDGIDSTTGTGLTEGVQAFGVGDPTLEGKFRLWGGPKSPVVIGGALDVSFPAGRASAEGTYLGNDSPVAVGLRGIFDGEVGPLAFGLNLRGIYRGEARLGSTSVGPVEFRYGAGAGYRLSPVFRVVAEGYGSTQFSAQNGTNSLQVDGTLQIQPLGGGVVFTAGGGTGLIGGVGVPVARAIAGLMFVQSSSDEDGDGIPDDVDKCPSVAEDKDGFEDEDGCPEDDNDHDGIPDTRDKCPNKPETYNSFQDEDGCPDDVADRDKDGIPDDQDVCPDVFGKMRTKAHLGCPDSDEDGIPDHLDKCPTAPEDTDGFQDADGCPDPDNDGDGIPDELDECVEEPETINGFQDADGCPDVAPK